ncbi:4Fe-4S dicluster domain-containing protein, partial [Adlercreutzia rubneri]|uniref:4Fe-4S dicluster domain-containing protein n=1 Tax=Adlercreutzia rubneri TaxID=2916441 RepID=UPI0027B99579
TKLAICIDLHRCIGCNTSALACKMQNNVPDGMLWNRVLTEGCYRVDSAEGVYPHLTRTYLPLACQHCENPACERVCPTGDTYKDDKGRVDIDYDKCIGWRMCMA